MHTSGVLLTEGAYINSGGTHTDDWDQGGQQGPP